MLLCFCWKAYYGYSRVKICSGLTDKRNITLTFVVSYSGEFLPMQIIYAGKTKASQPRGFIFPKGFSISQNPSHWSNEQETLKEVFNPYVIQTKNKLNLPPSQKVMLIWDAFKGHTVNSTLESLDIVCVPVPANMTHFFQPLDLTVNGSAKKSIKKLFVTYNSDTVLKSSSLGRKWKTLKLIYD